MKLSLAILALAVAACGGGEDSSKDLSKFAGATWDTTLTTTVSCSGQPAQSASASTTLGFASGTGADLQYTSSRGCLFKFNVSGDTANLANGPVSCSDSAGGSVFIATFDSYKASTSDGHHLTVIAAGNVASGGTSCPLAIIGSGTR